MRAAMAARHLVLILLACAVLPAAGSNVRAAPGTPDLDDLTLPEFKALLRWESYARAGCAVKGGCFDECLKGGLEVYDKPKGDSTGASIYLLSKLDNPPNSECRCPPAFGNMDAADTTFTGFYSGEPLILTVDGAGRNLTILVSWAGCAHVYSVEESFDRDGDGQPDFLGPKGAVIDTIPPLVGTILADAITATVAATIFANVATAVVEKFLQVATEKDLKSLAQGVDPEVVGVTGGALVPLLQQAGYLGIIGQIGGQGRVPAVVSRLSEGLAWVNFHLASLFANTTDSAPAVQKRRNLVASRRRHMRRMGIRLAEASISEANKCAKVEKSATELRSTVSSVAIAVGAAFATRTRDHVQGILELPYDELIPKGRMTLMQFFGFTPLAVQSIAGAASQNLFGSKELPTVMKSFMGLSEAALEATVSGCPQYLAGGIVVLVVVVLMLLFILYITRPGEGPVYQSTEYEPTGPQPSPSFFDQPVSRSNKREHAVLQLMPGQTWELVKPQRGEQVTGSSFGAGVPMQGMPCYPTSVQMSADLTNDGGLTRQTHVEMVSITIGGAAMGAEEGDNDRTHDTEGGGCFPVCAGGGDDSAGDPRDDDSAGDPIEVLVEERLEPFMQMKMEYEQQIEDLEKKIEDQGKQLAQDQKKKPATKAPKKLVQDKNDLKAMQERMKNFPAAQLDFFQKQILDATQELRAQQRDGKDTSNIQSLINDLEWERKELEDNTSLFSNVKRQQLIVANQKKIDDKQREIDKKRRDGGDTTELEREKKHLEREKRVLRFAKEAKAFELQAVLELLKEIEEEKEVIEAADLETSATLNQRRKELKMIWDAPVWMRPLISIIMLPSQVKQMVITKIFYFSTSKFKNKDPKKSNGDTFVGTIEQFPNFGGYKPTSDLASQVFVGRFSALFQEHTAERVSYQIWNYSMLFLQSIFIKVITSPLVNAAANLCLKAVDLTLKFSLAPHSNKTAYFDDILAQALNVLQVGVLFKFVKDKADGLVKGEGLGGDQAGVFFVGGALAAIGPLLFTAMYECFSKLVVLRRKLLLARAKMQDRMDAFKKVTNSRMNRQSLKKALKKAITEEIKREKKYEKKHPAFAAPNSLAKVRLTEQEIERYANTMAELLSRDDGQVVFQAAKEMKAEYLKMLNKAKNEAENEAETEAKLSSNSNKIGPRTKIKCILRALQTVMNDRPFYQAALKNGGKDSLFNLLQLPADLDLTQNLDAVASRLNSRSLIEIFDQFRKVMQTCSDFDGEKAKEYIRKAKLVLFELPWPEEHKQEEQKQEVQKQEVKSREITKICIRICGDSKDPHFILVDPGDKIKISRAPVRYGIDFSEMYLGLYVPKPRDARLRYRKVAETFDQPRPEPAHCIVDENEIRLSSYGGSKALANECYYKMTEAVVNKPFRRAHVDRTVVVDWGEDGPGFEAEGKIDTGARGVSLPTMMSVPPTALSIHPPTTFPAQLIDTPQSIQFAEYQRWQPGYSGQLPGYPGWPNSNSNSY